MEPVIYITDKAPRHIADATPLHASHADNVTIAEILLPDGTYCNGLAWPRALTDDEIAEVDAWLMEKYGPG